MAKLSGRLVWNLRRTYVMSNAFPVGQTHRCPEVIRMKHRNPLYSHFALELDKERGYKPTCAHYAKRVPEHTTHWLCPIGCSKPGNSVCFPTEISYSCTHKLAHKSPLMMCVVKMLVAMKNDSIYYVLILLNKNKTE